MNRPRRRLVMASASLLALGALAACASDTGTTADASPDAALCPITATDTWVKATDTEMTGAFGMLANSGSSPVTITAAASPSAGMMEIHEVVDKDGAMVMQPKAGGLVVPAGGTATLKPGSDHLMLMKLPAPIAAGDEVEITVTCDDGGSATWTSVAKPFEGGAETYAPAEGMDGEMDGGMDGGMDGSMSPSPSES